MVEIFTRPVISFLAILIIILVRAALRKSASKFLRAKKSYSETQTNTLNRAIDLAAMLALIFTLLVIWGVNTENIYIFITSTLALIAIGFVAVWSILSNVFAAVLLVFNKELVKGNKTIQIMPDNIEGKVKDITLLYTIIEDKKGDLYQIPNNMIFQKIIKISK